MHTLELCVCMGAALFSVKFFDLGTENMAVVVGLVLAALAKYSRETGLTPDAVNS